MPAPQESTGPHISDSRAFAAPVVRVVMRVVVGVVVGVALVVTPIPGHALPEDADKPINIRAKTMQGDQRNNRAVYTGDVQVDQGTLRVNAERMVVEVEDQKVTKITFNGEPARYQQQLNAAKEQVRARAQVIVYHTQTERLDLKGDAYLTQEGNEITGELIEYDIVAGKVDASSTPEEGPIRMILQPARDTAATPDNN